MQRMPWSIRSTPRRSSASRCTPAGPPRRRARSGAARRRARANSRWNSDGGLPTSAESRPSPTIGASMASGCSSTSSAASSDRSRRNAAISRVEMPNSSLGMASTDAMPSTHVSSGTPRDRWACGSKRSPRAAPRRGGPGQIGAGEVREVLLGPQHRHVGEVQVEERLQIGELVPRAQLVEVRVRQLHPLRSASAKISSGSRVPSMCRCSSATGSGPCTSSGTSANSGTSGVAVAGRPVRRPPVGAAPSLVSIR